MSYTMHTKVSINETEADLEDCFRKWRVRDFDVAYNVQRSRLRNLTLTRSERAVTVRWIPRGQQSEVVLSMDQHDTPADNLRVLYLAIDAMRKNEARGIGDTMRAAYLQLGAGAPGIDDSFAFLGVDPEADEAEARSVYRENAKAAHPDTGGSAEEFDRVQRAWRRVCQTRGWRP